MTDGTDDPGAWAEEEARGWNGFGHTAHVIRGLLARVDDLRAREAAAGKAAREEAARLCLERAEALAAAGDGAGATAARECARALRAEE